MAHAIWLLVTIIFLGLLILVGAFRAPLAPGRRAFTLSVLLALWWTGCVLYRHSVTDYESRLLACQLAWFGILGTPLYWSLSFITFARGHQMERPWQIWTIGGITLCFGLLALTNEWHQGLYVRLIDEPTLTFEHGWLYTAALVLGNLSMVLSLAIGLASSARMRGLHRWQLWGLLLSAVLPWLANISYTAYGFMLFDDDPTPFVFLATGAFMLGAQIFGQLFILPPIARDLIFAILPDPVLVLDGQGRIFELNPAAGALPGMPKTPIGKRLTTPQELVEILDRAGGSDVRHELTLKATGKTYDVSVHPLERFGQRGGQMIAMRDISLRKAGEERLEAVSRDLAARLEDNLRLQTLLHEEAVRDHLTGLFNRRHAHKILPPRLAEATQGVPLTLVIFDIDHFKAFNDRFGHETGDRVLQAFAAVLGGGLNACDHAFRWGGEEFLVVLDGVDRDMVNLRMQAWRRALAGLHLAEVEDMAVTFSAGICFASGDVADMDDLIKAADVALYAAKAAGRNCTVFAGEDRPAEPRDPADGPAIPAVA